MTDLDALVLELKTGVYDLKVIEKIASFGSDAIEPMIEVLSLIETSDQYFDEASLLLGNIHSMAEDVLIKIGSPTVNRLIPLLEDDRWGPRHGAIWCLHHIGASRAVDPLIQALSRYENDSNSAREVLDALEDLGTVKALAAVAHWEAEHKNVCSLDSKASE